MEAKQFIIISGLYTEEFTMHFFIKGVEKK